MRAGGCTLQQGLTAEAAGVVKQAVGLARRRGHGQVTPLHVASTMLSVSAGLLKTACLQSHSHPLQCRALELCFNVALNRLPASSSGASVLGTHHGHHSPHPTISNALIAAFKRAQAHQRRGSVESQQQPLLAVKIELEQLIISILDDPSVSRVMREAGFSSTQVKSNVEQAVSLEICSSNSASTANNNHNNINKCKESGTSNLFALSHDQYRDSVRSEDVMSVVECLVSGKKRSVVVVGECVADIEGVVRRVMEKVEKEDVPEELREVKFISLSLSSSKTLSRVEVEQKIGEVKSLLMTCAAKGVVLYIGDLKWVTEIRANGDAHQQGRGYYCPVEHLIMEIGKLVCGIGESVTRFWLVGIANFQTYMRCKSDHPSLESWGIHTLTIPAGSLRLSLLTCESDRRSDESISKTNGTSKSLVVEANNNGDHNKLSCCNECSAMFEAEARDMQKNNNGDSAASNLPAWLQYRTDDAKRLRSSSHDQSCASVSDLYKKWNSFCYSSHQRQQHNYSPEKTLITFSSVSPSSSASGFSCNPSFRDHKFWARDQNPNRSSEPSLRMYFPENKENHPSKQPILLFSSNPNSTPTSASSSDAMEAEYPNKFKELNSENLKTLCNALERKVPWQRDIIPEIATTVLQCRSGLARKFGDTDRAKEETWFFFQGVDMQAKEKIARELARLVFGSSDEFVSIRLSSFSATRADSTEDNGRNIANERSRDEQSCSYIERFGEAVSLNPHRVFFVEDVVESDYPSQMGFKRAIERGKIKNLNGEDVDLRDSIVILSCESFSSRSRACSPHKKDHQSNQPKEDHDHSTNSPRLTLDLNVSFGDSEEQTDLTEEDRSIDDIGLLECVDKRVVFKIQEL